jgi:hypothetical protein
MVVVAVRCRDEWSTPVERRQTIPGPDDTCGSFHGRRTDAQCGHEPGKRSADIRATPARQDAWPALRFRGSLRIQRPDPHADLEPCSHRREETRGVVHPAVPPRNLGGYDSGRLVESESRGVVLDDGAS